MSCDNIIKNGRLHITEFCVIIELDINSNVNRATLLKNFNLILLRI